VPQPGVAKRGLSPAAPAIRSNMSCTGPVQLAQVRQALENGCCVRLRHSRGNRLRRIVFFLRLAHPAGTGFSRLSLVDSPLVQTSGKQLCPKVLPLPRRRSSRQSVSSRRPRLRADAPVLGLRNELPRP